MAKLEVTPTPPPTPPGWDASEAARTAGSGGTTTTTVNLSPANQQRIRLMNALRNRVPLVNDYLLSLDTASSAVFSDYINAGNGVALFAYEGDRSRFMVDANDNVMGLDSAVNEYIQKTLKAGKIGALRELLVSKNAINEDALDYSRSFGETPDPIMVAALTEMGKNVSRLNYANYMQGKKDFYTFEEGLMIVPGFKAGTTSTGGSGSNTRSVRLDYQTFDPEEYSVEIDAAYRDITGQGIDDKTLKAVMQTLNSLAKKSPVKTVSTMKGDTVVSKTTGGIGQGEIQDVLQTKMLESPDTESYQKATTFMDYFLSALEGPVDLNG
jgi:hypothetical protein